MLVAEDALIALQPADVKALRGFAENGGRIVVAASSFFVGTVPKANELLTPYGLKMHDEEPRGGGGYEVTGNDIVNDALTKGVKKIKFDRFSPTEITDAKRGRILVPAPPYRGKAFVAAARAGKGEVIALGDSLWWCWIGRTQYQNSDNARLLQNLLGKERRRDP